MNPNNLIRDQKTPYFVFLFVISLFYGLGSIYPYQIETDVAFQLKSLQQLLNGGSNLFNALVIPNPNDLSVDIQRWIAWWPPGILFVFFPFIVLGLPLGAAVKLTTFILFIAGGWGWLKVAELIEVKWLTKILLSITLPIYAIGYATTSVASGIGAGDILPFAYMPWMFLLTLRMTTFAGWQHESLSIKGLKLSSFGLLLGLVYWMKYSAFPVAIALVCYTIVGLVFEHKETKAIQKLMLAAVFLVSFAIPFILLTALNQSLLGVSTAVDQYLTADFLEQSPNPLLIGLSSLGLSFFQSTDWIQHFIFFNQGFAALPASVDLFERNLLFQASGIPGTFLAIYLLAKFRKSAGKAFSLMLLTTLIPIAALFYLSLKVGYNFLGGDLPRYSCIFIVLAQILAIDAFLSANTWQDSTSQKQSFVLAIVNILAALLLFATPNLWSITNFTKNIVIDRVDTKYVSTNNWLYVPTLSKHNVKAVINEIEGLVKSPNDVVILNIPYHPNSVGAWLEIKSRCMLLNNPFFSAIAGSRNPEQIKISQALRVVFVCSKDVCDSQQKSTDLLNRFPQAKQWFEAKSNPETEVSIWYADLKV
ncbi:MAG: hypothetical protein KME35_09015 [Aphanocapsa sp. GSE-SYN-MK-11-07L]|jgi:hypothetical protein|nr:hypothetical protein [Aphanocapsa sp. GSE-SYN-MK-11-07L]